MMRFVPVFFFQDAKNYSKRDKKNWLDKVKNFDSEAELLGFGAGSSGKTNTPILLTKNKKSFSLLKMYQPRQSEQFNREKFILNKFNKIKTSSFCVPQLCEVTDARMT